jgi:hypothetical protein
MKTPHKHAEILTVWLNDQSVELEFSTSDGAAWAKSYGFNPISHPNYDWRIKPEPKPDIVWYTEYRDGYANTQHPRHNLKLTADGETGKLIKAEVIS